MAGFTGQGTIVALTSAAAPVACVRSITLPTWSMDSIDASCLSLESGNFMKKIAADLVDAGTVQITAVFEPADDVYKPSGTSDTLTVTLPDGGELVGTGFVSECTLPSIEIGGLLEQTFTFTFDGGTGPGYTTGTAS